MFDLTENRIFTKKENYFNFSTGDINYNYCDICGCKIIELRDGMHAYLCRKCSNICDKSIDKSENVFYNKKNILLQDLRLSENLFLKYLYDKELHKLGDSTNGYIDNNIFIDPIIYLEEFDGGGIRWM